MSHVHPEFLYTKEHEWVQKTQDPKIVRVGITDFAQSSLGDVTFVQVPSMGSTLQKDQSFGSVESVKAVSDLYAPVSGVIVKINAAIQSDPSLVNSDPFGKGWLVEVEMSAPQELQSLLAPDAYKTISQ